MKKTIIVIVNSVSLILVGYGAGRGWWNLLLATLAWAIVTVVVGVTMAAIDIRLDGPAQPSGRRSRQVRYVPYVVAPSKDDVRQPRMRRNPEWKDR